MTTKNLNYKTLRVLGIALNAGITLTCASVVFLNIVQYNQEAAALKEGEARVGRMEQNRRDSEQLLSRYEKERERFQALLFSEQDIPAFLDEIAAYAKKSKLAITNVATRQFSAVKVSEIAESASTMSSAKLSEEQKKKKEAEVVPVLTFLPIEVTLEGSFDAIVAFLSDLERYRQLLTLSDVEIKLKNYPVLSSRFTVNIYSLRDMGGKQP